MSNSIVDDKRALRRALKARLSALPPVSFHNAGLAVALALDERLWSLPPSSTIALFASRDGEGGSEIDVRALETKARAYELAIAVPRIDWRGSVPARPSVSSLVDKTAKPVFSPRSIESDDLVFHVVTTGNHDDDGAIHDLPRDRFGIPTPPATLPTIALRDCALVVVPGLGFDEFGGRLGYGRGYYDRALRGPGGDVDLERVVAIGLDEQLVPQVPVDDHDVRLRWLCTPARGLRRTG